MIKTLTWLCTTAPAALTPIPARNVVTPAMIALRRLIIRGSICRRQFGCLTSHPVTFDPHPVDMGSAWGDGGGIVPAILEPEISAGGKGCGPRAWTGLGPSAINGRRGTDERVFRCRGR